VILIGQYDSPFTRRVGLTLTLYSFAFEHRPWSVFGDADRIRAVSPLTRVPTLVLDDGLVLVDSHVICAHLDETAGHRQSLAGRSSAERAEIRHVAGLASGLSDKVVALFYELNLHAHTSAGWIERCRSQILATAALLEAERTLRPGDCWFGQDLTHADLAVTCALRHWREAQPDLFDAGAYPNLIRASERLEATDVFSRISQPFIPPA
jgi:glutathione S-transferase